MMTHRDFIPDTTERVVARTAGHVNRRIAQQMEASVARCADRPDRIARRLAELDREWDVERALEANAASLAPTAVSSPFPPW
jgi:Holliday junction resolvasome RuvABC ATP-dependent DNA helicase subunit